MEQFSSTKFHLRDHHLPIQNWSDDRWIACLAAGGGSKRRYQYCSDYLGSIIYLRALQGHSGGNLIDLTLQDNVLIGPGIFPYIYHVGRNFNLYSIISNGLIPRSCFDGSISIHTLSLNGMVVVPVDSLG